MLQLIIIRMYLWESYWNERYLKDTDIYIHLAKKKKMNSTKNKTKQNKKINAGVKIF